MGHTSIDYKMNFNKAYIVMVAEDNGNGIGSCKVDYDKDEVVISSWFVNKEYQNQGIGKCLLKEAFMHIPKGFKQIKYIWNGQNEYVGKWLEKFNAKNLCPINMLKYACVDTWDNHMYLLDKDLFLNYLEVS